MKIADRPPVVMVEGHGSWLWDEDGKRYLDFVQGWAVNCLGHSPARSSSRRSTSQARRLINCSPAFYNEQMARLATLLAERDRARAGVLLQQRRRGQRGRDQAGAEVGRAPPRRRATRSSRWITASTAARSPRWPPRASRAGTTLFEPKVPGFPKVPLGDLDAVRARDHAADRGGHARADPGRGRRAPGGRRLPARARAR